MISWVSVLMKRIIANRRDDDLLISVAALVTLLDCKIEGGFIGLRQVPKQLELSHKLNRGPANLGSGWL